MVACGLYVDAYIEKREKGLQAVTRKGENVGRGIFSNVIWSGDRIIWRRDSAYIYVDKAGVGGRDKAKNRGKDVRNSVHTCFITWLCGNVKLRTVTSLANTTVTHRGRSCDTVYHVVYL